MMAMVQILAVVVLFVCITNTHAQGSLCTTTNIQHCVGESVPTPLLLFPDVQTMTMNDYCSNYRKVKRCRSSFADNCTDIVKKEYAGVDEKMTLICKNNGAEYAKHIDCMHSIKRKRAELGCYRAYKSGEAHIFEMTTNSWSEWRDKYCQQTKTFLACTRQAVTSNCKKDTEIWTDLVTKASLTPLMEALWCQGWRRSASAQETTTTEKIDPTPTPDETAIKYWLMVVPGLLTAIVTAIAIAIVHRLRHGKETNKQPRRDVSRDGTQASGQQAGRSARKNAKKKGKRSKSKEKNLNRSQNVPQPAVDGAVPSGRENRPEPTRQDQSSAEYATTEPSTRDTRGPSVYEAIALQQVSPRDPDYEKHGPTDKPNVYATLTPEDDGTYTKLGPTAEASGSTKKNKKKSHKKRENTYVRLSKKK